MRGAGPLAMPAGHRILADGSMEFVFQLGDPFRERQPNGEITKSAAQLSDARGPVDLDPLALELRLSQRQFHRRFEAAVGIGPKRFSRLIRFQRVFEQRQEQDALAWSEVALECGYYDQAHFNHDFRAFTGVKPRDIVKDADPLTAFFLSVSSKTTHGKAR